MSFNLCSHGGESFGAGMHSMPFLQAIDMVDFLLLSLPRLVVDWGYFPSDLVWT